MTGPVSPVPPARPLGPLLCPHCGRPLVAYVGYAGEAPWVCTFDALSFHPAELAPSGRVLWDAAARSFRRDEGLRAAVVSDVASAVAAGVNVPQERLGALTTGQLSQVRGLTGLSAGFRSAVDAAVALRSVA